MNLRAPLFVPGDRPERFPKAAASGTDMVVIDLEDAVASPKKDSARRATIDCIAAGFQAAVRINGASTDEFRSDLDILARARPAAVMLPKFEAIAHAELVRDALGSDMPIIALVETSVALGDLGRLLSEGRITQAAVGTMDLAAELGCLPDSKTVDYVRALAVIASRIAGIAAPLDGITATIDDDEMTEAAARGARDMGFGGKLCIHPRQVNPVLRAFLPTQAELAWARSVVNQGSDAAGKVNGEMIDAPVIRRAQAMLDRAGVAAI